MRRARRRRRSQERRRVVVLVAAATAVVVASVAVTVAMGGAGRGGAATKPKPSRTTRPPTSLGLTLGKVGVESAGAPGGLAPEASAQVVAAIDRYVQLSSVDAMRTGAAGNLAPVFTTDALSKVTSTDRAVLADEHLPKVRRKVQVSGSPVALSGLADQDGTVVVVTASIDVRVAARTTKGNKPILVERRGELVLVPDGGGWKIDSYDLSVARSGKGLGTTTTTTTATSAAASSSTRPHVGTSTTR
jgi:hypothetical protein